MLALEITCHFNNDIWNSTDDELFEKCVGDLESDGFISRSEVKQFFTIRIKNAYPFYRLGYEKKLTAIFDYFKQLPGLVLAGRTGAYKYMDINQCMEDTAELIKRFKKKGAI